MRTATTLATWSRHDFCPWANPYVRWLKQPLGWFAFGAVAAGLVGAFVAPQAWLLFAVLVVVATLGVLWPLVALRGVSATLAFDRPHCHEGESVVATMEVTNRWPWPAWGLTVEHGDPDSPATSPRGADDLALVALDRVPGWSLSRFTLTWHTTRRGRYPRFAPQLTTGFPFGLWSASRPLPLRAPILVRPRTIGLTSSPCVSGPTSAVGAFVDRAGDDGGLLGARPFRPGDSLRRVHWVHTARRDTLLVCERQSAAQRSVRIELDVESFTRLDDPIACDWVCRIIASMSREFVAHGCEVAYFENAVRTVSIGSPRGLGELFDRLAVQTFDHGVSTSFASREAQRRVRNASPMSPAPSTPLWIVVTTEAGYQASTNSGPRTRGVLQGGGGRARHRAKTSRRYLVLSDGMPCTAEVSTIANGDRAEPWMTLPRSGDIERQFQQQWERSCHDDWAQT